MRTRVWIVLAAAVAVCGVLVASGRAAAQTSVFSDCDDCPLMVEIPGGTFRMGLADWWTNDAVRPAHDVTVRSFAIGLLEVTKAEYAAFTEATGQAPHHCVYRPEDNGAARCLTWYDAQAYVEWLTRRTGRYYRLPSEAEWEYVAQGADLDGVSRFGVQDMFSGASEWMADCHYPNYQGAPADGSPWADDPGCLPRVVRGTSAPRVWTDQQERWPRGRRQLTIKRRAAQRGARMVNLTSSVQGMRVVRAIE